MPRIDVPDGQDPLMHLWAEAAPHLSVPAAKLSDAVYNRGTLPVREMEAARITIARINDCQVCRTMRADDVQGAPDEAFYDALLAGDRGAVVLSARESLASEFAERFATDHLALDDDLWQRLHAVFDDGELVELALCVGAWLAFGRINRVFDVDGACRIPSQHVGGRTSAQPAVGDPV
jgi:alkylhydroperoxidase family enzyme